VLPAAGTDMNSHAPLQTPFDKKKAAAIGVRKWVRFAKDGETTIMQARVPQQSVVCEPRGKSEGHAY
jgi:hypothetical protein